MTSIIPDGSTLKVGNSQQSLHGSVGDGTGPFASRYSKILNLTRDRTQYRPAGILVTIAHGVNIFNTSLIMIWSYVPQTTLMSQYFKQGHFSRRS